jgi:predicted DCC family thiol-disulfide oxidoreductase YuxK
MSQSEQNSESAISIVYDGDCPFCSGYVTLMRLRAAVGKVELVDARNSGATARMLAQQGYDLNEGMAVIFAGQVYHGKDAVVLISAMTGKLSWTGKLLAAVLRNKKCAAMMYPAMKFGRKITLKLLGIPQL